MGPVGDIETQFLEDAGLQLRKYKGLAEKALAQVSDADLFRSVDPESNSIAIVMKHVAGNMRSRWTDFLTTDGEKADRNRDTEFEIDAEDSRPVSSRSVGGRLAPAVRGRWRPRVRKTCSRTVTIRGEAHTVLQAIQRQLTHYAYHVGQIVFLARHFAGDALDLAVDSEGPVPGLRRRANGRPYRTASEESR